MYPNLTFDARRQLEQEARETTEKTEITKANEGRKIWWQKNTGREETFGREEDGAHHKDLKEHQDGNTARSRYLPRRRQEREGYEDDTKPGFEH